jgi:hypothetical protein
MRFKMKFKSLMLIVFLAAVQVGAECEPTPTPTPSPSPSPSSTPGIPRDAFTKTGGNAGSDAVTGAAVDLKGNVLSVNSFSGTVSGVASKGETDVLVTKYSPNGSVLWVKGFGGPNWDSGKAITTDKNGDVYFGIIFSGVATFGGASFTASGPSDMALVKLSGVDGSHVWSKQFGSTNTEAINALKVDNQNNVLLTGYFRGTINFGGTTLKVPFDTDLDVYIAKLTGAGAHVWSKNWTNNGNDQGRGISVDAQDNIALVGTFSNTINFGGGDLTSMNAMTDAFLAKFTKDGTHVFSKRLGAPDSNEDARGVAVDLAGNIAITGLLISKPVDFGGGPVSSLGGADGFIAVYGPAGAFLWAKVLGGSQNDYSNAIASDAQGNFYVAGYFLGAGNFGGLSATAGPSYSSSFVAKFNGQGVAQWVRTFGGTQQHVANAVATNADWVVLGGYFYGTWNGVTSAGAADSYLMQLK